MDQYELIPASQWPYAQALAERHLALSSGLPDRFWHENADLLCGLYVGEQLAGICLGQPGDDPDTVMVLGPYLMEDYRQQGRGSRLLTFFEEQAGRAGFCQARVGSAGGQAAFFQRNGYTPLPSGPLEKSIQGVLRFGFGRGQWRAEDFFYAASAKYHYRFPFEQEEPSIYNLALDDEYAYTSMLTRQSFSGSLRIAARCSFQQYGAPLIVLTDDLTRLDNGALQMGRHWEIVAFEGGINVWELTLASGQVIPCKLGYDRFEVPAGTPLTLEVELDGGRLTAAVNGRGFSVDGVELPRFYHVGITACEGVNRFWSLDIDRI